MNGYIRLKNLASLIAVTLCCALASSSAFAIGKKTAKSYPNQADLIAQFDAIANAGWTAEAVERSTRLRGEIIWGAGFAVTVR